LSWLVVLSQFFFMVGPRAKAFLTWARGFLLTLEIAFLKNLHELLMS
jgi:hypothetical protein